VLVENGNGTCGVRHDQLSTKVDDEESVVT
jgi:hypothetical protein